MKFFYHYHRSFRNNNFKKANWYVYNIQKQYSAELTCLSKITFSGYMDQYAIDMTTVDIIIPVFNALEHVKNCIESIQEHTKGINYRVIIVNDASDAETSEFLREYFDNVDNFYLAENYSNLGYTKSVNIGLKLSNAKYSILLNSDTIVTKDWLKKMIDCIESDNSIGIVGPLSNAAGWQSVPIAKNDSGGFVINPLDDLSISDMAIIVSDLSLEEYPRVSIINGCCFMIKREVIDNIGYMDEINFPTGYGEEYDYCFRALNARYELAVADCCYVYHAKSKSFEDRVKQQLISDAAKSMVKKYGDFYKKTCAEMDVNIRLNKVRNRIYQYLIK